MKKSVVAGLFAASAFAGDYKSLSSDSQHFDFQYQDYPKADLSSFRYGLPSSGSYYQSNSAIQSAINNAKSTIVSSDRSIDSLFLKLPSFGQIDRLILNADSVAISKTIQVVATKDSLTCDQRVAYLLQVLGRVKTAVEKKQFHADQLKVIIDGARIQIQRLQGQIGQLQINIKNLYIDKLQADLKRYLQELEDYYRRFNSVEREIAPKQATVAGLKRQVQIISQASDAERNRISTDKLKLSETRALIRDLQNRLSQARQQRGTIEAAIKKSELLIRDNQRKIQIARQSITQIQFEIRRLQDETDSLRSKYSDLEIEVERLRTEISIAQTKADEYRAKIAQYQQRITIQERNLVQPQLDNIQDMISTLKRLIPSVQKQIDRHYYYCYGEGVKQTETRGVVVYIVKGQRFQDYIQSNYGSDIVQLGQNNFSVQDREVRLNTVNIFGQPWSNKFGYPFSETSLGGDSNRFDIAGSFNCLAPSRAKHSAGRIKGIHADYLDVDGLDGQNYHLYLGSCSRLQSRTALPEVGQRIAFSGVPGGQGNGKYRGINTYKATCY